MTAAMTVGDDIARHVIQLVQEWSEGVTDFDKRDQLVDSLDSLAVALRDESIRASSGETALPEALVRLLEAQDEAVWRQTGRVAANLAIDNDANRLRLVEAGYITAALRIDTHIPSIIASLHNLAIDSHAAVLKALREKDNWAHLTRLAGRCDEDSAHWCWTTLSVVYGNEPSPLLDQHVLEDILTPLSLWPEVDEAILSSCASIIELISADEVAPLLFAEGEHFKILLDFVEEAQGTEEDDIGQVKGALVKAIVELSVGTPKEHVFWERIRSWLCMEKREDLVDCALLSLGNGARTDASAVALLQQAQLLPTILALLVPTTSARTQHSVISLLRNLSIPEENKKVLGEAGVVSRLMDMGVWSTERDMLGSVQGGAIGIIKNLCRRVDNAEEFTQHPEWVESLLNLLDRTDDQALRFEGTRTFVNTIRTLAQNKRPPAPADVRVVKDLGRMLKEGEQHPILQNEAIIALTLLASFGPEGTASTIAELHLDLENITDERIKENAAALQSCMKRYTQ